MTASPELFSTRLPSPWGLSTSAAAFLLPASLRARCCPHLYFIRDAGGAQSETADCRVHLACQSLSQSPSWLGSRAPPLRLPAMRPPEKGPAPTEWARRAAGLTTKGEIDTAGHTECKASRGSMNKVKRQASDWQESSHRPRIRAPTNQ